MPKTDFSQTAAFIWSVADESLQPRAKDIKDNLKNYVQSFSRDAREIFGHFNFSEFVGQLDNANQRRRQSQPRCCATRIT
ncbi:hypothetical protein AB6866_01390 [Rahnella inusitata]|uniref:hypothetical protein n=1 Tax=Rahnella inusitata TaxID=58169 RepID=UPI0039BE12AF